MCWGGGGDRRQAVVARRAVSVIWCQTGVAVGHLRAVAGGGEGGSGIRGKEAGNLWADPALRKPPEGV